MDTATISAHSPELRPFSISQTGRRVLRRGERGPRETLGIESSASELCSPVHSDACCLSLESRARRCAALHASRKYRKNRNQDAIQPNPRRSHYSIEWLSTGIRRGSDPYRGTQSLQNTSIGRVPTLSESKGTCHDDASRVPPRIMACHSFICRLRPVSASASASALA